MTDVPSRRRRVTDDGFEPVTPESTVAARREKIERTAAESLDEVEAALGSLVDLGAWPPERWRQVAHVLHCRFVYERHVRPFEAAFTNAELANRLNRLQVPRYRGETRWSAGAISDIRSVLTCPHNRILLPAP